MKEKSEGQGEVKRKEMGEKKKREKWGRGTKCVV
jgi:hypothetical protein